MEMNSIARHDGLNQADQGVGEHLEEVAELAEKFSAKIGLSSLGRLEGLLHDLGKYSNRFQAYIRSTELRLDPEAESQSVNSKERKGKVDHSTAGAQLVWEAWKDADPPSRFAAQAIALCVASHHSGLIDCLSPDGEDKFSARMAKGEDETHLSEVLGMTARDARQILDETQALLRSRECVTQLKGQLERLLHGDGSREVREFSVGLLVRFLFSALIDADRLSAAGRGAEERHYAEWNSLIERLERHISEIERNSWVDGIRSEVSLACREFASKEKGLYQLTVPTGGGKTLSSLRFGLHHAAHHRMDRLIYVVPYTTIIDQNATVARSILEEATGEGRHYVVLEHHSNLTPEKETSQSMLLAENWDSTVIFTTTVQFLEALFGGGTRGVRRMHQLANAVIIFDEIQTIPVKTVHLFNNTINFLVRQCGATVVFSTATQPLLHAVDATKGAAMLTDGHDKADMVPNSDNLFKALHRVEVLDERRNGGWTESEIAQLVCDEARKTNSALAVVNTRSAARDLFHRCSQQIEIVYHLSTNMCPAHRMKIINEIKKEIDTDDHRLKHPLVCVSTQLIEAGVDVDFGSVVRYLAGLDSIAQAAGRCNRNARRPLGRVTIVNPSRESLDTLPEIRTGREIAERVLDEYRHDPSAFDYDLLSPKAMRRFYEYYFFSRAKEMTYRVSAKCIGHDDDLLTLLSTNALSVEAYKRANKSVPALHLRQSFKTAANMFKVIDAPTEGVIVPYGENGRRIIADICAITSASVDQVRRLLREAQRYSVSLFSHDMEKLLTKEGIHETQRGTGIFYLDEQYYSEDLGVVLDPKEPTQFLEA